MVTRFPFAPEDVAVEMFAGGKWEPISGADIRWSDQITITGGYSEVTRAPTPTPSRCEFTVDNNSGNYSPDNPRGIYYGLIRQGTPLRVATRVAKSSFSGTASNGWAVPEVGGSWTAVGTASQYSEGSGSAKMSFTAASQTLLAYQAGQLYRDIEVSASFTLPFSDVTGGAVAYGIALNGITTSDYFLAKLTISTAEAMTLDIVHITGAVLATAAVTNFSYTGQQIRMKAHLSGQQLRAKVWPAASTEPYAWQADASYVEGTTEGTVYADRGKGWVGIYGATAPGQTNVTFALAVDDFEARINDFHGEVSAWKPELGKDTVTRVEAAGIRRRLSQGQSTLPTTYTRANRSLIPAPLLYYPCEDGTESGVFASGLPGGAPMVIVGTPQFAASSDFAPGSAPIAKPNNSRWFSPRAVAASTGKIQLIFLLSIPDTGETNNAAFTQIQCTGSVGYVDCYYDSAGTGRLNLKFYDQNRALVHTSGGLIPGGGETINGTPYQVSIELTQNGANIDYVVALMSPGGSGWVPNGTVVGFTIGAPLGFHVSPYAEVASSAMGHIQLRNDIISIFTTSSALNAYNGEGVRTRISRLCAENDGVNFARTRSTINDQQLMGKQKPNTFLALLDEVAKTDMGFLLESRDIIGLVLVTMRSLYNRDAFVTLDYAKQLQGPFEAPNDDQLIINDFTASRVDGASYRATQTTGPLALTSPTSGAGVGRYNDSEDYSLSSDTPLADMASWVVHVGTEGGARYPRIAVDVSRIAQLSTQLYLDLLGVWVGDRVDITNPKPTHIEGTISQIVYGYRRKFGGRHHTVEFFGAPAQPYAVAEVAAEVGDTNPWVFRTETDGSTVNTTAAAGALSLSVATPSGPLWTTAADDYPRYVDVGGIRVRATACSGASSPQTFTVDALPVARAAGLSVSAWHAPVLAQ